MTETWIPTTIHFDKKTLFQKSMRAHKGAAQDLKIKREESIVSNSEEK